MILSFLTSFIIKDINNKTIAKYPIHSVTETPSISTYMDLLRFLSTSFKNTLRKRKCFGVTSTYSSF